MTSIEVDERISLKKHHNILREHHRDAMFHRNKKKQKNTSTVVAEGERDRLDYVEIASRLLCPTRRGELYSG